MLRIESIRNGREIVTFISEGRLEQYELPAELMSEHSLRYTGTTPRQDQELTGIVGSACCHLHDANKTYAVKA